MDVESLKKSISDYKQQLKQIDLALSSSEEADKNDLLSLKSDVEQLIELTEENLKHLDSNEQPSTSQTNNAIDDEYMLFMQEMAAEGVESNVKKKLEEEQRKDLEEDLKSLEGMKCQAPHKHSWGGVTYHNALVCAVVKTEDNQSFNDIQVRIFFTNPTHREMLPCPYFLEDSNCKFTEDKCRFSHGETVAFSSLKEYVEPNFEKLKPNCRVLAKSKDNLWHRAVVVKIGRSNCSIRYESSKKEESVDLKDVLPLEDSEENEESSSSDSDTPVEEESNDWAVQKSLLSLTPSQALGDWEKHTKGIGSKLMQQMGYIVGTGLGKNAEGRIDPVQAVILPSGKSLDHCMNLRELAGGDEDLFSAERKLKKQQKQQEALSKKAYEREKNKKDVFQFLNETLTSPKNNESKSDVMNKEQIKTGTSRDLNVASLKLESDIKKVEQEIYKIKDNLTRLKRDTVMHKNLMQQLAKKSFELNSLKDTVRNVTKEQNLRKDKKKLTVF